MIDAAAAGYSYCLLPIPSRGTGLPRRNDRRGGSRLFLFPVPCSLYPLRGPRPFLLPIPSRAGAASAPLRGTPLLPIPYCLLNKPRWPPRVAPGRPAAGVTRQPYGRRKTGISRCWRSCDAWSPGRSQQPEPGWSQPRRRSWCRCRRSREDWNRNCS